MKRITIILLSLSFVIGVGYGQAPIKRNKHEKTEQAQSASSRPIQQQTSNNKKKVLSLVKVSEPDGYINGHGYVDLGLPSGTKWATCNVGAALPSDYGSYFAWGEIDVKTTYTQSNSKYYKQNGCPTEINGMVAVDAAANEWVYPWQLPTRQEAEELSQCRWKKEKINGVEGYIIIGPNEKSIFLPGSGYKGESNIVFGKGETWLWLSTNDNSHASALLYINNVNSVNLEPVFMGMNIRAVVAK